ncbi:MAG: hypothetical protein K8I29_05045 [Alphaproteobacteria bacterium]|uniref:Beta-defensin n=1 Tax=Candidatus Nitrobium versatile TaxID=2884831 RepID=A0A953M1G1_9BACT|nr:hypothetical protein [Candidatus Nitrobium versatile]
MKRFPLLFLFLLFIPLAAFAGEDCSALGGKCRDACSSNETAEKGAFLDCTEKQECCVPKEDVRGAHLLQGGEGTLRLVSGPEGLCEVQSCNEPRR